MPTKQYLIETFEYNDYANKLALAKIGKLSEPGECIRFFSHLINSMNKWLARITNQPGYAELDWWLPEYAFDRLELEWAECLKQWISFINERTEEELFEEVQWFNPDFPAPRSGTPDRINYGPNFAAAVKDIALQLNYHAVHHRAQIQYLIRQQGIEPDFVDYIGTKYRQLS